MVSWQGSRDVLKRGFHASMLSSSVHHLTRGVQCRLLSALAPQAKDERKKMVILGSGWAACHTLKDLKPEALRQYDITMVSPNNYYVYTPMLPSVTVGTLEPRSIVEPVRNFVTAHEKAVPECSITFSEAEAIKVDPEKKVIKCVDASPVKPEESFLKEEDYEFDIPYDVLVLGVGATTNTFGTPGAVENCLFLKSIADALKIRSAVVDCFETATVAFTSSAPRSEIERLLSFVVVGAGPTGVEIAAELRDFILDNLRTAYPHFKEYEIKVQIVEMADKVLNTYDKAISEYTQQRFKRQDIEVLTRHQVKRVNETSIEVLDLVNQEQKTLPFGMCVWASGVRPTDISLDLAKSYGTRMLETDSWLRVRGAEGTIFALGDCAKITTPSMKAHAKELFDQADKNKDGQLSAEEFMTMMEAARSKFPHIEAYLGAVTTETLAMFHHNKSTVGGITPEIFEKAATEIDKEIKMLPPTAQVAAQQGAYLADLLSGVPYEKLGHADGFDPPFRYNHQGAMAYVGADRAVIESPIFGVSQGIFTMLMWRGAYWTKSVSIRCKILMGFDWAKTFFLGRDTSRL